MIAGPSDTAEEMRIARQVISDWNDIHSYAHDLVLLPLNWISNSYPDSGKRPQEILNNQLIEKSDMLIAIFATKLGTPTGGYESGTIEEIEEHLKANKPIMLFFKTNVDANSIDKAELVRLKSFQQKIGDKILYGEYETPMHFKDILNKKLHQFINEKFMSQQMDNLPTQLKVHDLSDYDIDRLKVWTLDKSPVSVFIPAENGGGTYKLGLSHKYVINSWKERAEWTAFFEKLEKLNLICIYARKFGFPQFMLKQEAYEFVNAISA